MVSIRVVTVDEASAEPLKVCTYSQFPTLIFTPILATQLLSVSPCASYSDVRYCLPKCLWIIHSRVIEENYLKLAVWEGVACVRRCGVLCKVWYP